MAKKAINGADGEVKVLEGTGEPGSDSSSADAKKGSAQNAKPNNERGNNCHQGNKRGRKKGNSDKSAGGTKTPTPPLTDEQKAARKALLAARKAQKEERAAKRAAHDAQAAANKPLKRIRDRERRKAKKATRQRVAWVLTDAFYECIKDLLCAKGGKPDGELKNERGAGRPHKDFRLVLEGIFFVLRTGIQWKAMNATEYGSGSTLHRYFQLWQERGVFQEMWKRGLLMLEERNLLDLYWQSVDGSLCKARLGGDNTGANPTDRAKMGTKKSAIVEGNGIPLGLVLEGANVHDIKLLEGTIDARIIDMPEGMVPNLCLDKGYDSNDARVLVADKGYNPHVVPRGEEKKKIEGEGFKARRWVVERAFSFMNFFRKILVRYEKKSVNYMGLLEFSCAFRCFRMLDLI
jgi:putative transposase